MAALAASYHVLSKHQASDIAIRDGPFGLADEYGGNGIGTPAENLLS
jgi:hypothetical protein